MTLVQRWIKFPLNLLATIHNSIVVKITRRFSANTVKTLYYISRILFVCLILYTMLVMAWVGDDAQITIRQIWNFIQGDGITFNFAERVQAFTHPLWFLTLSSIIAITGEVFNTIIFVSITFTLLAILILFRLELNLQKNNLNLLTPVYLLLFSWAFCDYTTSGLENSLSFLLTGILLYLLYYKSNSKKNQIIFIILALIVLNRMDYSVLFAPLALVLLSEAKTIRSILSAIYPGILILIAWFGFATLYFGAPFPNTFYAKLNNDFTTTDSILHGLNYLIALKFDISTIIIILSGIGLSFFTRDLKLIALSVGQIFYIFYIIWSGGDFMQGRFFSVLVFLSVGTMIISFANKTFARNNIQNTFLIGSILVCVVLGINLRFPFFSTTDHKPRTSYLYVGDERGGNYRLNGLFSSGRSAWIDIKDVPSEIPKSYKTTCGLLGGLSLSNSSYYLIDSCALSDPFLSRISPIHRENSVPGHYYRKIPTDYGEYLLGNIDELPDQKLNPLLNDVSTAVRGELFSIERLLAILRLNTGFYDEIDFNTYKSLDQWIPITTKLERIELSNWSQELEYDKLPGRFHNKVKKFNGNLLVESSEPLYASGIWLYLDFSYSYDVYVNDKLIFKKVNQPPFDCKGITLEFSQSTNVRSVKLIATELKNVDYSGSNRIRELTILKKEDLITYQNKECSYEPFVRPN